MVTDHFFILLLKVKIFNMFYEVTQRFGYLALRATTARGRRARTVALGHMLPQSRTLHKRGSLGLGLGRA